MHYLGNGKTISIKVIMKSLQNKGFVALYVKSFKSKIEAVYLVMS